MKHLTVPIIDINSPAVNDRQPIINAPWSDYPYQPDVTFSVVHDGHSIRLTFYVREKTIRAAHYQYNTAVYEDSCVEWFIAFDGSANYYNLEINCVGTILMAYGSDRNNRSFIDEQHLKKISRKIFIEQPDDTGLVEWQLTVIIPVAVFRHENIESLSGKKCKANFYKCGDLLPDPHFLCWSPINSPEPNFHLPEFFGEIYFE